MGFLRDFARNPTGTVSRTLTGNPVAAVGALNPATALFTTAGQVGLNQLMGGPIDPGTTDTSQQSALQNRMIKEARDYRERMPGLKGEYTGLLYRGAKDAEGKGIQQTRSNFNKRGLLYSGLREKAEQDVKSGIGSQLASSIVETNKGLEDTARAKEEAAASVGLQSYNQAIDRANELADIQYQSVINRQQALQRLGQGIGMVAGYSGKSQAYQPMSSGQMFYKTNRDPYAYQPGMLGANIYDFAGGY